MEGSEKTGGWFIDSFNGNIKEQYHFIEKLASGGFGVVYLAEHRKTSKCRKTRS
jgi:serine/threonine protein kinase